MVKYIVKGVGAFFAAGLLVGCNPPNNNSSSSQPTKSLTHPIGDTLTLTIVPYEAADKLTEEYAPMASYLAKKMGARTGKFYSVSDYSGVLSALQNGQVDVAYLSPLPYGIASREMKLNPLVMPFVKGSLTYHGIIFVKRDSPIKSVKDLKGKTFAFGDALSTTGYLLPRRLLEQTGVKLTDLKQFSNVGDANMVVQTVEDGGADAGSAYDLVFMVAYRDHPEKKNLMRVIGQTEDIPNGIYVARGDLPKEQVEKLKQVFMGMNDDPEGKVVLAKAPNDKVVLADDSKFNGVREAAKTIGLDLKSLDKKKK